MTTPLTFDKFAEANRKRADAWHGAGGIQSWSVGDWAVAMAGEAGEVCDAVKKYNRLRDGFTSANPRQPKNETDAVLAILKEIGDTGAYLDLLAQRCGSSLGECMRKAFNDVSEREGFEDRV